MDYGVIGEHLTHSFSKEIHNLIADYDYKIKEIPKDELEQFMVIRDFKAINVTIPYKQEVIPHLYYIDEKAKAIHAVNTIVNKGGNLYGYNTDYFGMSALIARIGITLTDKKVLILGTGGTAHTARAIANDAHAQWVYRVSRSPAEEDCISYEDAVSRYNDAQIIINTTPCGMFPKGEGMPINLSAFPAVEGVVDAIYNPLRSRLILDARSKGIPAEGGLYMLVAQGVKAVEHFLDITLPVQSCDRVYNALLSQKENVVLVGMPGCGKTTIGKLLAQQLGRPFVDMDDLIIERIGCPISEYFEKNGEAAFRQIEAAVAREQIASMTGAVIATGGGAVLREDNVSNLRANGRLYFIDRPLEQLIGTADRPTANSREALKQRFEERYQRYCSVCDVHIHSSGIAHEVAQKIGKDFSYEVDDTQRT